MDDKQITVERADAATLILALATSVKSYNDVSADPATRCVEALRQVANERYQDTLAAHVADHRALFRRVSIDLGPATEPNLPTDRGC